MSEDWKQALKLPKPVKDGLGRFCTQVREGLGSHLQAILLFGSAAKGEYHEQFSDLNVMIVLTKVEMDSLDKLATWIQRARREIRLETMIVELRDIERSTDVFPIKYMDIKQYHVLLGGKDVLQNLKVEQQHLRLRCEQELKNQLTRLRGLYIHRAHSPELLEKTLYHATTSLLISLNAMLFLRKGKSFKTKVEILDAAASEFSADAALLKQLLALRSEELALTIDELKSVYRQLMASIDVFADIVDRMEDNA